MASARSDALWQALLLPHLEHGAHALRVLRDCDAALFAGVCPPCL